MFLIEINRFRMGMVNLEEHQETKIKKEDEPTKVASNYNEENSLLTSSDPVSSELEDSPTRPNNKTHVVPEILDGNFDVKNLVSKRVKFVKKPEEPGSLEDLESKHVPPGAAAIDKMGSVDMQGPRHETGFNEINRGVLTRNAHYGVTEDLLRKRINQRPKRVSASISLDESGSEEIEESGGEDTEDVTDEESRENFNIKSLKEPSYSNNRKGSAIEKLSADATDLSSKSITPDDSPVKQNNGSSSTNISPIKYSSSLSVSSGIHSRRQAHIVSEQKRRQSINEGFEDLRRCIPTSLSSGDSKAVILRKAVNHITMLQAEVTRLRSALSQSPISNSASTHYPASYPQNNAPYPSMTSQYSHLPPKNQNIPSSGSIIPTHNQTPAGEGFIHQGQSVRPNKAHHILPYPGAHGQAPFYTAPYNYAGSSQHYPQTNYNQSQMIQTQSQSLNQNPSANKHQFSQSFQHPPPNMQHQAQNATVTSINFYGPRPPTVSDRPHHHHHSNTVSNYNPALSSSSQPYNPNSTSIDHLTSSLNDDYELSAASLSMLRNNEVLVTQEPQQPDSSKPSYQGHQSLPPVSKIEHDQFAVPQRQVLPPISSVLTSYGADMQQKTAP